MRNLAVILVLYHFCVMVGMRGRESANSTSFPHCLQLHMNTAMHYGIEAEDRFWRLRCDHFQSRSLKCVTHLKQRVAGVAVDSRAPWTAVKRSRLNMTKYHILEAEGKSWLQNPSSFCRNEVVNVLHPWNRGMKLRPTLLSSVLLSEWICLNVPFLQQRWEVSVDSRILWTIVNLKLLKRYNVPHSSLRGMKLRMTLEPFELSFMCRT